VTTTTGSLQMRFLNSRTLKQLYYWFRSFLFDPVVFINRCRAVPYYVIHWIQYSRRNQDRRFGIKLGDVLYTSADRFAGAGTAKGHYFFQDLWAAQYLYERRVIEHVDIGSRLDGFIAHLLVFSRVVYVDLRPLASEVKNFEFRQGSIVDLPFDDDSVISLSCLHVIEHIGLGRYGDPIDPNGYLKAAQELARVLAPGGILLLSTPVGREHLCFDAHRVFDPQTIVEAIRPLQLKEFHLIEDQGLRIVANASFETARRCDYGCGLFVFTKAP
jgi:SAM-dependent methyltransferase